MIRSARLGGVVLVVVMAAILIGACASGEDEPQSSAPVDRDGCADVVEAVVEPVGDGFRVSATVLSADTGWEKYADAWEVRAPDGTVLGTRELAHPHVDEQPFTRSLANVDIPETVTSVEIAARDSVTGFCGEVVSVDVPSE